MEIGACLSIVLPVGFYLFVGVSALYWLSRAKRAEADRQRLREELRTVASVLAYYHDQYFGSTQGTLGEIITRLSATCPCFAALSRRVAAKGHSTDAKGR